MGVNKAFLEIDEIRLIDRTLAVYRQVFNEIIIVTNEPCAYLEFNDVALVTDIYKEKGPIGGIFTGLFFAKNQYIFVSACDLPYLNADFILYLGRLVGRHDVIVPETAEGYQPLCAVYSRNCLPVIKKRLETDNLKITGFYKDARVLAVTENQLRPFDPCGLLFRNLNTPSDFENAKNSKKQQIP
jgi:molybdopterin-guanine dinucleotide biosynthesis protein A